MSNLLTVASSLQSCLCEQLAATPAGVPCYCGFWIGGTSMPTDACSCAGVKGGKCGTAWVRLETAFPSSSFPQPDVTPQGSCTGPLAWRFNIGVVRCQPGPDARGKPPNAAAFAEAMGRLTSDIEASYRTIECCFPSTRGGVWIGSWLPVGNPDAMCSGGYWPVTVWSAAA